MGGKNSKQPKAPDPYKTASAEAQFNRLDTYGAGGGGERYGYTDANGNFVQGTPPQGYQAAVKQLESPYEAAIRQMLEPASGNLINRIITDNVTNLPNAARAQDTSGIAKSIFDRNFSLMAPTIEKGEKRLLTNLQNRGLPVGGEAFNEAYTAQQRETQDMISRLAQDADINAGQEQSRLFGIDQAQRSNAISELVAAMGGGYSPASAQPGGNAAGVNYAGLVGQKYNADVANWQQNQQNKASTAGTLGSIAGAAIMKSDRRVKRDIRRVGKRQGLTLYEYRYAWDKPGTVRRGYMAQEVFTVVPEAIRKVGKWLALDYSLLPEVA